MVSNVSFTGGYNAQDLRDLENIAKYSAGVAINSQEEGPFTGQGLFMVGLPVLGGVWNGGGWLWKNRKNVSTAWDEYRALAGKQSEAFKLAQGLKGKFAYVDNSKTAREILKSIKQLEIPKNATLEERAAYEEAQKLYDAAKTAANGVLTTSEASSSAKALEEAEKGIKSAEATLKGVVKKGIFSRAWSGLKSITGYTKASEMIGKAAESRPMLKGALKYGKGTGLFLAIEGAMALFTQIIPSFTQLGAGKGFKQLGKSTVKVGARVGGWVAGEAGGTAAGAMLGAEIGLIGGPVGAAIGGVLGGIVGFAGGCLGQWAAGKAADAIVGKDELEIAKEANAEKIAENAKNNPQTMQEIMAAAEQRLQAEGANSADAKMAFGSLKKLAQQKAQQEQTPQQNGYQSAAAQSVYGNSYQSQYAMNNPFSAQDYMNKDFMAASAGLA